MQMIERKRVKTADKETGNRSERGDFLISARKANLFLEDGSKWNGIVPSWQSGETFFGEVVFNTGMTGYVESLTDPSYANQILVFTYPLIGNYGVQPSDFESAKIQVAGVVMSELAVEGSHLDSTQNLIEWLESQNVPLITEIDTRALTKHLRSRGVMIGAIAETKPNFKKHQVPPNPYHGTKPIIHHKGRGKRVVLVDCGAKGNILDSLLKLPLEVLEVPEDYDFSIEDYDAVVYSNGPGDPTDYQATIEIAKKVLNGKKPVFGICLGNQIMGLAAGAKTFKLKFGHRGHNQPCMEVATQHCYITSQNHGYAINPKTLPKDWEVSFINLNDNSVEGIKHKTKPFFSVQFHPEACPGPTDTQWLFAKFEELI